MQQERPSAFLIIKEPPFTASYDRTVYIERVLGEMEPSYDFAEYRGVVTLLVRALPRSPAELNRLITEAYPDADLDLTRIGPFEDTDGGKGIRVAIYTARTIDGAAATVEEASNTTEGLRRKETSAPKQDAERRIEVEAATLDEARKAIQSQVPQGFRIRAEQVVSDGTPKSTRAVADNVEDAFAKAARDIPGAAVIVERKEVFPSEQRALSVDASDETSARSQLVPQLRHSERIETLQLVQLGRRGFLGIGRKPNRYEAMVFRPVTVEIVHRSKAKVVTNLAEVSKEELNSDEALKSKKAASEKVTITDLIIHGQMEGPVVGAVLSGAGAVQVVIVRQELIDTVMRQMDRQYPQDAETAVIGIQFYLRTVKHMSDREKTTNLASQIFKKSIMTRHKRASEMVQGVGPEWEVPVVTIAWPVE